MPDYNEIEKLQKSVLQQNVAPTPFNIAPTLTYEQMGSGRYPTFYLGLDNEDLYGQNQSSFEKWTNAAGKFGATTVSTFLQGTAGLINGLYQWIDDGKFSSFYNNEFNKGLDVWTTGLENTLPNYYTNAEKNADWYSPKTWWTANFWADTVFKNTGFVVGAALSGGVWSKALGGLVSATSKAFASSGLAGAELSAAAETATLTNKTFPTLNQALKPIAQRLGVSQKTVDFGSNAVRAGMGAFGESSIEALHAYDEYKNRLIQQYTNRNGFEPQGEDLQRINELADDVGNYTFGANLALLSVTNYIQFPKLGRLVWGQTRQEATSLARGLGSVAVDESDQLGRRLVSTYKPNRLLNIVRGLLLPFSGSEAFEEGAQYAIPITIEDYINKGERGERRDILTSLGEGIKRTFSDKQGMLSILTGALTGGLVERIGGLTSGQGIAPFRARQSQIVRNTQTFVDLANETLANKFIPQGVASINRFENSAREANEAALSGDRLSFEDAKTDAILAYMLPRIQYGRGDLVNDDIQAYISLANTSEGWNTLMGQGIVGENMTQQQFVDNMIRLQNFSNNLESEFNRLNTKYPELENSVKNLLAYSNAKIDDYNERIPLVANQLRDFGIPIDTYINSVVNNNITEEDFQNLANQIDNIQGISPGIKDNLKIAAGDVLELTARRQLKIQEYQNIIANPTTYQQEQSPIIPSVEEELMDITINGEPINQNQIYDFGNGTRGFIVQETQDNNLIIEDEQGNRNTVSKDLLIQNPNEKAQFYLNNRTNTFNVGGRFEGQLTYNPQTNELFIAGYEITSNDLQSGNVTSENVQGDIIFEDSRNDAKVQENLKILQEFLNDRVEKQADIQEQIQQRKIELENIQNEMNVQQWSAEELVARKKGWLPNFVRTISTLSDLQKETQEEINNLELENITIQSQITELQDLVNNPPADLVRLIDDIIEQQDQLENLILENGYIINSLNDIINSIQNLINRFNGIIRDKLFNYSQRNINPLVNTTIRAIDTNSPDINSLLQQVQQIENFEIAPAKRREQATIGQIQDLYKQIDDYSNQIQAKQNIIDSLERNLYPIINPIKSESLTENVEIQSEIITEIPVQPIPKRGKKRTLGEPDKKPLPILFKSTVLPRGGNIQWYKRFDNFTKRFRFFPQPLKSNLRAIYITANNEDNLGLTGIIESTTGGFYQERNISITDINQGRILIAIIETDPETQQSYFIDENGNRLGEIGTNIDISQVLVAPMSNTSSEWENYEGPRYAERDETTIEKEQENWRRKREEIFQEQSPEPIPFLISRGRPTTNLTRKSNIVNTLISEDQVGQSNILTIVGSRNITTPYGEIIPGLQSTDVIIENGDAIEKVFANELNASNIANLFTALSIRPDQRIVDFLSGQIYMKEGQNWIDIENQKVTLNGNIINFTDTERITQELKDQTQNVNRNLLQSPELFTEFIADENGNLTEYEYQNYQAYLVSPNYPNGEKRTAPIFTYVKGFEDKYLILQDQVYGQKQEDTEPQAPEEVEVISDDTIIAPEGLPQINICK